MKIMTLAKWLEGIPIEPKESLPIYEVSKQLFEPENAQELAKRFDIKGKVESDGDIYLIREGKRVLVIYKASGAFYYGDFSKLDQPDYKPELPSEKEAEEVALSYLKNNKWLPESSVLDGIQVNQFERVEGRQIEQRTIQPNHICVDFRLSLGKYKTYGPGAKIKLFIGHNREIIGMFYAVRSVEEYADFSQHTRSNLLHILKRKLNFPLEKTTVKDVKLAYFYESPLLDSRFVQPIYVFTLSTPIKSKRRRRSTALEFVTHPMPATTFAPIVTIDVQTSRIEIKQGEPLRLSCKVLGGKRPFNYIWESDIDGHLSDEPILETDELSLSHRGGHITSHTIKVTVTDQYGNHDTHQVAVKVYPKESQELTVVTSAEPITPADLQDPYVGVEWCNLYHGSASDISGTDASAKGFKDRIRSLSNWSSRFDWGNDAAWEQDFKFATASGGGTDSYWTDNVHFAFFAGHGSPGSFWFGSTVDDHEQRAQDSRWGDGILNWIVLHACQTMRANFGWTVWCGAFKGLHQMLGFHTNTEGSTPPLGSRFAFWMSFRILPWMNGFDMRKSWRLACTECFDSSMEYAMIYAGQSGTDTYNDHLPGFGHVSTDPTTPTYWVYSRGTC